MAFMHLLRPPLPPLPCPPSPPRLPPNSTFSSLWARLMHLYPPAGSCTMVPGQAPRSPCFAPPHPPLSSLWPHPLHLDLLQAPISPGFACMHYAMQQLCRHKPIASSPVSSSYSCLLACRQVFLVPVVHDTDAAVLHLLWSDVCGPHA